MWGISWILMLTISVAISDFLKFSRRCIFLMLDVDWGIEQECFIAEGLLKDCWRICGWEHWFLMWKSVGCGVGLNLGMFLSILKSIGSPRIVDCQFRAFFVGEIIKLIIQKSKFDEKRNVSDQLCDQWSNNYRTIESNIE